MNLAPQKKGTTKSSFTFAISVYTAYAGGVLTPTLETIRRWNQLSDIRYFINWFDDYLMGAFLFFAAWKVSRSAFTGLGYLIAAWGIASGMAFGSFVSQMQSLNQPDPAPVSSGMVAVVKGAMLITCLACLKFSIRHLQRSKDI